MKDQNFSKKIWREKLTSEEFSVCWEKGTEPAFSGKFNNEKATGVYICRCCRKSLFHSDKKYDSGSGWPSFFDVLNTDAVNEIPDDTLGMIRIEARCSNCGSHLGHIFTDGPQPTGLRYCINSLSLDLVKK
tara:strand:- start:172 stop:564 length:393 start_codon:yes stop_codon:yes gene_type:complete